jgi:hypothetical protein
MFVLPCDVDAMCDVPGSLNTSEAKGKAKAAILCLVCLELRL